MAARSSTTPARCRLLVALVTLTPSASQAQTPPPGPDGSGRVAAQSDTALLEARSLLQRGKLDEAEQLVRQRIGAPPPSADAHFLLGQILFRQIQAAAPQTGLPRGDSAALGQNEAHSESIRTRAQASLAQYAEGARYRDPDAFDLKIAALNQVLLGDYVSADGLLTKSVGSNPKDAEAWYYLGRTKYNENRFEDAIHALEECLKLEPRNIKAKDNLGLSYAGLGRAEEAIAAYRAAIAEQAAGSEKNAGPFLNLGSLLLEQNRPREALPCLLQAVESAPRESRAHERLGKAYMQLEDPANAQAELEKAIALDPESAPLHFILGQAYRKSGLIDKAKAEFDRAAALNGSHSTSETPRP